MRHAISPRRLAPTLLVVLSLSGLAPLSLGCGKVASAIADVDASSLAAPPSATTAGFGGGQTAVASAPPPDVPSFLERFCDAVAKGDKAYVKGHTDNGAFSSTQGSDPDQPQDGRRTRRVGGHHADADFTPVCTRIRAQAPGDLRKGVRVDGLRALVRLRDGKLASDLVVERVGNDFRLLREEAPNGKVGSGGAGGAGGGGW